MPGPAPAVEPCCMLHVKSLSTTGFRPIPDTDKILWLLVPVCMLGVANGGYGRELPRWAE